MKKLLFFLGILIPFLTYSQDVIYLKNGREINCLVISQDSLKVYFEMKRDDARIPTHINLDEVREIGYFREFNDFNLIEPESSQMPAHLYFYRLPDYIASDVKMKILVNNTPVVRLEDASWFNMDVSPGDYRLSCRLFDSASVKVRTEPGRSYFIRCALYQGFLSSVPILIPVDSLSGRNSITTNYLERLSYKPIRKEKTKNRFGIFMGGGTGFEKIQIGVLENGDDVTLSTGGGLTMGMEYGREFGKYFELAASALYQVSFLSVSVENCSASFQRMGVLLTPSLVMPVRDGSFMRVRMGGGPGLYTSPRMKIDASEAGGFDISLNYDSALGFHTLLLFESNFSERESFNIGLKMYSIKYTYNPVGSTGYSTEDEVMKPDGSGLDFVIGYNFHF